MKNSFDEKILEEAHDWVKAKQKVVLATVIQTWGSSPRQTCLLYTSPSPRDATLSRMPSSA